MKEKKIFGLKILAKNELQHTGKKTDNFILNFHF
jgi:hypothetical protein